VTPTHVVTGAFGYSGRFIAERLLARGLPVRTLTNSPRRAHGFGDRIEVRPYDFDRPDALEASLRGAAVLYNTYWVRFDHGDFDHATAVRNTETLFAAAKRAGVGRVVHVSITNPSDGSPYPYFRGKARLERALRDSGLPHSVLRPAVLFGHADILVNNIAWVLRRLPVFGIFGDGRYRLQPMHVEDFADLAVAEGAAAGARVVEAIGPETFTYRGLVEQIGAIIGKRRPIVRVPAVLGLAAARVVGALVGDVTLTRDEIGALMDDLLYVDAPPAGTTKLTDWARAHRDELGRRYASELARRINRTAAYETL
jgi:NADH dehydrogenase